MSQFMFYVMGSVLSVFSEATATYATQACHPCSLFLTFNSHSLSWPPLQPRNVIGIQFVHNFWAGRAMPTVVASLLAYLTRVRDSESQNLCDSHEIYSYRAA